LVEALSNDAICLFDFNSSMKEVIFDFIVFPF